MTDRHKYTYMGPFEQNIDRRLQSNFDQYLKKDGSTGPIELPPEDFDGLFVGFMEQSPRIYWVVAVFDGATGAYFFPAEPLKVDPARHVDGKGFGPGNARCGDTSARHVVDDLVGLNPDAVERLRAIKGAAGL
ncbi:MAG: hypothetical protein KC420_14065 [Myxococcales bacterium]|nr:hypothetical protein [Myxococcales bacterium]